MRSKYTKNWSSKYGSALAHCRALCVKMDGCLVCNIFTQRLTVPIDDDGKWAKWFNWITKCFCRRVQWCSWLHETQVWVCWGVYADPGVKTDLNPRGHYKKREDQHKTLLNGVSCRWRTSLCKSNGTNSFHWVVNESGTWWSKGSTISSSNLLNTHSQPLYSRVIGLMKKSDARVSAW